MKKILCIVLIFALFGCAKKESFNNPPIKVVTDDFGLYMQTVKKREKELGGYANWIAPTGSMRPLIQDYDWVIMLAPDKAPFEDLKIGDIIAYKDASGGYILHRIWGMDQWGFILGGDNNPVNDEGFRLTKESYVGKLVEIHRFKSTKV